MSYKREKLKRTEDLERVCKQLGMNYFPIKKLMINYLAKHQLQTATRQQYIIVY